MKIGILTVHNSTNYGAVLQCYALQKVLINLGNDVEVIDYDYLGNNEHWTTLPIYDFHSAKGFREKIIIILKTLLFFQFRIERRGKFRTFVANNLKLSKKKYKTDDLSFGLEYDCFVIGSDQLWSKKLFNMNPVYWGNFKKKESSKVLTYAVSAGSVDIYDENDRSYIQNSLSNFSFLSVREDVLKRYIETLTTKPVETVLDPTLLLDKTHYENLSKRPAKCPEKYVLIYRVGDNALIDALAEEAAKKYNAKIVEIGNAMITHKIRHPHYIQFIPTVEEFLGCFQNALCVFSKSFHGLVFSLMFRKQFYVGESEIMDRVNHLLSIVDLQDRIITENTIHKMTFEQIDYDTVESKLKLYIQTSMSYLTNSIVNK